MEPKFKKRKRRDPNAKEIADRTAVLGTTAGKEANRTAVLGTAAGKEADRTAVLGTAAGLIADKKVMPKEKPKDFYEGEGYKGAPDMYPDYEEDKKELKKSKMNYGGSTNKYKSGSYVKVKTKLAKTKPCKLC